MKSIGGKAWKGSETVVVIANKAARGIGILWYTKWVSLYNFSATQHSLSAAFHILGTDIQGFITNVYGPPRVEHKMKFLGSLRMINALTKGKP